MKSRLLERTIVFAEPRDEIFSFFCQAENLEELTPDFLNFQILTPAPIEMKKGALIDYRLKLYGIPVKWRTRISHWDPPHSFTDEQIKGPYRTWIHTHTFEQTPEGTVMRDRVEYASPGWIFEPLVHNLFVSRNVEGIFDFREQQFADIFTVVRSSKAAA